MNAAEIVRVGLCVFCQQPDHASHKCDEQLAYAGFVDEAHAERVRDTRARWNGEHP